MSAHLTLDCLCAKTPDGRALFDNLTLSVGAERVGLVGRNGSGKSTLLRIIAGLAEPSAGTMSRSGTIGLLNQNVHADQTVAQALGVAEAVAVLDRIVHGNGMAADFDKADWSLDSRIAAALAAVDLAEPSLDDGLNRLSGGERTRIGIARLILDAPDVLLLDEPTNNLDAAGRAAVDALIAGWRGAVLVASHDRSLLEKLDRIVELTPVGVRSFGGGWSDFVATRDADRERAVAELARAQNRVDSAERKGQAQREAKDRRDKAGRAFAAKRSEPKILLDARAERAENSGGRSRGLQDRAVNAAVSEREAARAQVEVRTPLTIELPSSGLPANARVLALDAVAAQAGERRLGPWTLHINGPERIALNGANGAGKTTLLRVAAGLTPTVAGTVYLIERRIALLDQHVALLHPATSIVDNVRRLHPEMTAEQAHAACARFAFRARDAGRIVATLSGGERLRAGLAATLGGPVAPWLIMLDEPTNHLDLESIEVLETALRGFDGALLVVSHDRAFLESIGVHRELTL